MERGTYERTDRRAIGYCPKCKRPFKWHQNDLDVSKSMGVQAVGPCKFLDGSEPGYAWGYASRRPAREYATGARVTNETCAYINPDAPGYPCLKPRGHDEDGTNGIEHDHGYVPVPKKIVDYHKGNYRLENGVFIPVE